MQVRQKAPHNYKHGRATANIHPFFGGVLWQANYAGQGDARDVLALGRQLSSISAGRVCSISRLEGSQIVLSGQVSIPDMAPFAGGPPGVLIVSKEQDAGALDFCLALASFGIIRIPFLLENIDQALEYSAALISRAL